MKPASNNRGFTIIELMVAITVLTVLTAIIAASFMAVTDSTIIAQEAAEEQRVRQFLTRSFSRGLASVYSDAASLAPDFQFLGIDESGPNGPADSLSFCSATPLPGVNSLPGMLKVVSFSMGVPGGDAAPGALGAAGPDGLLDSDALETTLTIMETPLVLAPMDGFDEPLGAGPSAEEETPTGRTLPIRSLDFEYYHSGREEWVEEWDSNVEGFLPWAVRVKINLARTREEAAADMAEGIDFEEEPDIDLTVVLPLGAGVVEEWMDINQYRAEMGDTDNLGRAR